MFRREQLPCCISDTHTSARSTRELGSWKWGEARGVKSRWGSDQVRLSQLSCFPGGGGGGPLSLHRVLPPLALVLSTQCPQDSRAGQGHACKSPPAPALQPNHQLLAQGAVSAEATWSLRGW